MNWIIIFILYLNAIPSDSFIQGSLSPKFSHGYLIATIIKCGMKFIIIYPFSNFNGAIEIRDGEVISPHTLLGMWLLIHAGI